MLEITTLAIIMATFILAGTIKGVIGLGFPTLSLAILTVAIDLPTAMGLLLMPSFVTNLWQALTGGSTRILLIRLWPFLLMATATVGIGAIALTRVDFSLLSALLGLLLAIYSVISLCGLNFNLKPSKETWAGVLLGSINGVFTGMTGSFAVPGILYLQALGLSKDQLIQSMGMLFTASTLALAIALGGHDLLSVQLGIVSSIGIFPALIGMVLGQRIRRQLSEQVFRHVFFIGLLLLGIYIIAVIGF